MSGRSPGVRMLGMALAVVVGTVVLVWGVVHWRARRALEDGIRLVSDGAYSAAVPALVNAVTAAPDDPRAHYYLGVAYFCLGAHGGALDRLRETARLGPRHATDGEVEADLGRAAALLDRGDAPDALAALRDAVERDPESLDARLFLAETLDQLGDRAGTADQYREVMRRAHGTPLEKIARVQLRGETLRDRHCR